MEKFVASKTQRLILDYMLDFKIYHAEIIKTMHEKFLIFWKIKCLKNAPFCVFSQNFLQSGLLAKEI
jgi:hypothetical protein